MHQDDVEYKILTVDLRLVNMVLVLQEEEEGEAALEEEDLYTKAETEFWSIINQEKKAIAKKKGEDMDKADPGKVHVLLLLIIIYFSLQTSKKLNFMLAKTFFSLQNTRFLYSRL